MKSVNESSQQDRRVYVGNLSYDVKWHHLKDHMRKGEQNATGDVVHSADLSSDGTLDVLFADVLLLPNGMSKVNYGRLVNWQNGCLWNLG